MLTAFQRKVRTDARIKACGSCMERRLVMGISLCGQCGCVIAAKARLSDATCPLDKWPKDEPTAQTPAG